MVVFVRHMWIYIYSTTFSLDEKNTLLLCTFCEGVSDLAWPSFSCKNLQKFDKTRCSGYRSIYHYYIRMFSLSDIQNICLQVISIQQNLTLNGMWYMTYNLTYNYQYPVECQTWWSLSVTCGRSVVSSGFLHQ